MFKVINKNQIIIFAVAFMLVTAGYLSYSMKNKETLSTWSTNQNQQISGIGDAKLVSSENVVTEDEEDEFELNNVINNENNKEENRASKENLKEIGTSAKIDDSSNYFSESRLERDKMYSEKLESYQALISENNVSSDQKSTAQSEISKINNEKNAIMIAENLIRNKGFKDIVIFVNNGSISVVVKSETLEEAQIAQIQSIIQRELSCKVEDIHISNK